MNLNSQDYELEMFKARKEIAIAVLQSYKFNQCTCNGMPRDPQQDAAYLGQLIRQLQDQIKFI